MPDIVLAVAQPEGRLHVRQARLTGAQARRLEQHLQAAACGDGHKVVLTVGRAQNRALVLGRWLPADRLAELHALLDEAEEPADADA